MLVKSIETPQGRGIQHFHEGVILAELWGWVGGANYKETMVW